MRVCRARAEREGWQVVVVLHRLRRLRRDRAAAGLSRRCWRTCAPAAVEVVLAESLDRLSRDQEHIAGFFKQASFAGVRIVTLAEGEVSELHVGLKGTMGALYLKDLADKTRRGLEGRVRQGRSGGGLCYGYRVVRGPAAAMVARRSGACARSTPRRPRWCGGSSRSSPPGTAPRRSPRR